MSYWQKSTINLGTIKAASGSRKVVFKATEDVPEILTIVPLCGCTLAKYDKKTRELHINYENGQMPQQVQGAQQIAKRININYEGGTGETLIITATRIR